MTGRGVRRTAAEVKLQYQSMIRSRQSITVHGRLPSRIFWPFLLFFIVIVVLFIFSPQRYLCNRVASYSSAFASTMASSSTTSYSIIVFVKLGLSRELMQ